MHDRLPLTLIGSDSTEILKARMAATAHRLLAEAMAKPPLDRTTPAEAAACLDDALAALDPTYSARAAEIVADLCRRLDRLHNEREPSRA